MEAGAPSSSHRLPETGETILGGSPGQDLTERGQRLGDYIWISGSGHFIVWKNSFTFIIRTNYCMENNLERIYLASDLTLFRDFTDLLFKVREFCTLLFKVFQFILSKVYHVGNWRLYDKTYLNYFKI